MLHALLPPHELYHLAERLPGFLASQQEASAALQQHREVLDVCPGEVVQAHFEHVQDDVRRYDAELRKIGEEGDVAHADFCELLHDILLAL